MVFFAYIIKFHFFGCIIAFGVKYCFCFVCGLLFICSLVLFKYYLGHINVLGLCYAFNFVEVCLMMKVVKKNLKIRIYPSKADKNDKGEKIVSKDKIDSNISHARFVWNKSLEFVNNFTNLLVKNGYKKSLTVYNNEFNMILNWLKDENDFLKKSESSSLQQVYKDLIDAFKDFSTRI